MTVTSTPPTHGQPSTISSRIKASGLLEKRAVVAFLIVLFLVAAVVVVWVSALQAQVPRHMPFGVMGRSAVVRVAESKKIAGHQISFNTTTYPTRLRR